ncbi:Receptor tyrosine-protein kinase erbB-2 [Cichlidogyrus casuarinus]|uniref:Receptor tyrosine-protein kinase erbB-2 n=1 Tax=Cichlidogyrus casuarinus TaxID=1844966 RepID=A0ABD2QJ84_9PLAT
MTGERKCSVKCDQRYGCLGPEASDCIRCSNWVLEIDPSDHIASMFPHITKLCLDDCNENKTLPLFTPYNWTDGWKAKRCGICHPLCDTSEVSCTGPRSIECGGRCKYAKINGDCLERCPENYFASPADKTCLPCAEACTILSQNRVSNEVVKYLTSEERMQTSIEILNYEKQSVCQGPEQYITKKDLEEDHQGCNFCQRVQLELLSSADRIRLKCLPIVESASYLFVSSIGNFQLLPDSEKCPVGYYFRSIPLWTSLKSNFPRMEDMQPYWNLLDHWFFKRTIKSDNFAQLCLPCDPECDEGCTGPGSHECNKCKNYYHHKSCVSQCPESKSLKRKFFS